MILKGMRCRLCRAAWQRRRRDYRPGGTLDAVNDRDGRKGRVEAADDNVDNSAW